MFSGENVFLKKPFVMNEKFLHFIWKHQLFDSLSFVDLSDDHVTVLDPGFPNEDEGPDFLNARVKVGNVIWAGNVEIHRNASDWDHHGHHASQAYDNVILHVVRHADKMVYHSDGRKVPTALMVYDEMLEANYRLLLETPAEMPCKHNIEKIEPVILVPWLTRLAVERIEHKMKYFLHLLEKNCFHWEETLYQALARGFGMNVNALPFEWLAQRLPFTLLAHYRHNKNQLEALLFGQAGMLRDDEGDEYYQMLKREYEFLRHKHHLVPLQKHVWKFMRTRPGNFPTVRIAQLADVIYRNPFLFSSLVEEGNRERMCAVLAATASSYWDTHYVFSMPSRQKQPKIFSVSSVHNVIVNVVVPFLFLYAHQKDLPSVKEKAIALLEDIPPEKNKIVKKFTEAGVVPANAMESQALIELNKKYCALKRCLDCSIGTRIIVGCE